MDPMRLAAAGRRRGDATAGAVGPAKQARVTAGRHVSNIFDIGLLRHVLLGPHRPRLVSLIH
jgi:hypothetical protein